MKCKTCGAENSRDAAFCQTCGESLEVTAELDVTSVTPAQVRIEFDDALIHDRFRMTRRLGKGGMGEVFLAEDVKLKRSVAVKSISTDALADPAAKSRFLREAQTASQLDHQNICTIYEIYEEEGTGYIVMQYIDGVSLDHIIRLERLSPGKILDIAIQVCQGMIEAGEKKIIHRDIKPANIMIDRKGVVKILDFGLAKIGDKSLVKKDGMVDSNLTEKGIVLGTASYISPEQARGQSLDQRTDIFSFGATLYEMIEGKNPFQDEEQIVTLYNILNKEVALTRDIPGELKKIVLGCLEKDKSKRPADFAQLKSALERVRDGYQESKRGAVEADQTERIDLREQEQIMKEIKEATDKEELGDIVYRIKQLRATTEPVLSTKRSKIKYILLPALLLVIIAAALILLLKKGTVPLVEHEHKFYVILYDFENKTGIKELGQKIDYLLAESLNQFDQFKTIDHEAAFSLYKNSDPKRWEAFLKKDIRIGHELKGTITRDGPFYTIEARLFSFKKAQKDGKMTKIERSITSTGETLDSLLISQVDTIGSGVYHRFFPGKDKEPQLKKISKIYGSDWKTFSHFYKGFLHYKKLESDKAIKNLLEAGDSLMAKYILAEVYNFKGDRGKAQAQIDALARRIDDLTGAQKLQVLACKARLAFDFQAEIAALEALKNDFPLSKEIFYRLGEAYFHYRDPEQAIPFYQEALEIDWKYTAAINHLAYCHTFMGNHTQALPLFEDYKNLDQTANSYDSLGDGYFYAGNLVNAEAFKKRAIDLDEESVPYSYITLAEIYILKAVYEQAKQVLERYGQLLDTPLARARSEAVRAFLLYDNREYDAALAVVDRSLAILDSDDVKDQTGEAHWIKGLILLALDRLPEAQKELAWLDAFKEKYNLTRDNFFKPFKYWVHLQALIQEREKRIDAADETFRFLLAMKNKLSFWTFFNYQFFHTAYARFLTRNQLYTVALGEIDKCLEFNGDYIPALWAKAEILEKLNDNRRFALYSKLLELYGPPTEKNYWRNLLMNK